MRKCLLFAVAVALLPASAVSANASPFTITYSFAGSAGNQASEPADAQVAGLLASDITRGPGVTASNGLNSLNSSGWTTALSPDAADYYQLVVTPDAGSTIDLAGFSWTGRRSATGPVNFQLLYSLDGFTTSNVLVSYGIADLTGNFRFSGATLSLIPVTSSPVTLRLFAYNAEGAAGTFRLGIDASEGFFAGDSINNLEITGDVTAAAVPEPASLLLLGSGLAIAAARRARRRA